MKNVWKKLWVVTILFSFLFTVFNTVKTDAANSHLVTYFQAYNKLYVSVKTNGKVSVTGKKVSKSEKFEVIVVSDKYHAFRSVYNGKYLSVNSKGILFATAKRIGKHEKFIANQNRDFTMSLKCVLNGKWVTVTKKKLVANKKTIGKREKFEVVY